MMSSIRMHLSVEKLKTAIICTLAPARIKNVDEIKKFVEAGMRIVRLNFSHIEEFSEDDEKRWRYLRCAKDLNADEMQELESLVDKERRDRKHAWNLIKLIREAEGKMGIPIGIMMDLCGPRIRTGIIKGKKVEVKGEKEGDNKYTFTSGTNMEGDESKCDIPPEDFDEGHNFAKDLERWFVQQKERLRELEQRVGRGQYLDEKGREELYRLQQGIFIYVNDGRLKFKIENVDGNGVHCTIARGGILEGHKGVNVPYCELKIPPITRKDHRDLDWIFRKEAEERKTIGNEDFFAIDYVAKSFVKNSEHIHELRGKLPPNRRDIPIIAKIETPEALDHLQEIMEASDGVMVARGDLGVELSLARVPRVQRDIINKAAVTYGSVTRDYEVGPKFVIVATQMLESMIKDVQPLRAEVADINTAILEGADAIMTSAETIQAEDPTEVVRRMVEIAREAERERDEALELGYKKSSELKEQQLRDKIAAQYVGLAQSACILAQNKNSPAIVVSTWSGRGAKIISSFKPRPKVIAITDQERTVKHLLLYSGVYPVLIKTTPSIEKIGSAEEYLRFMEQVLKNMGLGEKEDVNLVSFFGIQLDKPPIGRETVSNTVRSFRVSS